MKALRIVVIVLLSVLLVAGAGYLYASSGIKSKPGFAVLDFKHAAPSRPLISVKLGPGGMGPVRWLLDQVSHQVEGEFQVPEQIALAMLQEVQGVQLQVYATNGQQAAFNEAITDSITTLKANNWEPLITVRESDNHVAVLQYGDEQHIAGLSVMVSSPENAVFLNLIGPFDPAEVQRIASGL